MAGRGRKGQMVAGSKAWIAGLLALWLAWPAMAQGVDRVPQPQARILAIGDSLLAWHGLTARSIPQVVARALGEPVDNRAVSGAHVIYNLPLTGAMGMRISAQFGRDAPDWVIVSGGGNDLWLGCGCRQCQRRMDRMISADGRKGAVPALLARIRATGARVVYVGYLRSPGRGSLIDGCRDEGDAFEARIAALAARVEGVHFLSNADLVPDGDRSFHAPDGIHPSIKGSRAIGNRVAALIARLDATRQLKR